MLEEGGDYYQGKSCFLKLGSKLGISWDGVRAKWPEVRERFPTFGSQVGFLCVSALRISSSFKLLYWHEEDFLMTQRNLGAIWEGEK